MLDNYSGTYIPLETLVKLYEGKGAIEPNDIKCTPMLRVVRCHECKYSIAIGVLDEDTGKELLGCTHLVNGMDEEGWVMTVSPYAYCSWGELE